MGSRLSPPDAELYRRTDEILHYLWDPIGVSDAPGARDEYHAYLPHVFSLLKHSKDGKDIADYLLKVEAERMGFQNTKQTREHAQKIAEILLEYRKWITEKTEPIAAANRSPATGGGS